MISAHWEAPVATVTTAERPPLLFDYSGFPANTYALRWPAPGDPGLAARVRELVSAAGFETAGDPDRGFDHGDLHPVHAHLPRGLDAHGPAVAAGRPRPGPHLALGRALAPLRDEGVLIVGSGMSYHDMRGFFNGTGAAVSRRFDAWLSEAATAEPRQRDASLQQWASAPDGRRAHPREEHLLPLMVVAGAAGPNRGRVGFHGSFGKAAISAFEYG